MEKHEQSEAKPKYKASDIAAWLINRDNREENKRGNEKMTLTKLMICLYYCQGEFLAIDNERLFPEEIIAWEDGPAIKEIYEIFKDKTNLYENVDILNGQPIDEDTVDLLEQTYSIFGKRYTETNLIDKTYRELPWLKATNYGENLRGIVMDPEDIKEYFRQYYTEIREDYLPDNLNIYLSLDNESLTKCDNEQLERVKKYMRYVFQQIQNSEKEKEFKPIFSLDEDNTITIYFKHKHGAAYMYVESTLSENRDYFGIIAGILEGDLSVQIHGSLTEDSYKDNIKRIVNELSLDL